MKKVITGVKKRKRIYHEETIVPTANSFTKDLFKKPTRENTRRITVLNKLFITRISDLMTTGDYASTFAGYGIEINKVKVTPDYHGVNVYWIAKENVNNDELEHLLQSKSGLLRHELSQLQVMGVVPRIKFIRDKEYARFVEVDRRLANADFGEDYEKTDASLIMKSYFELNKPLDSKLKERITSLDNSETIDYDTEIPPMPQNVLSLNHSEIMERVKTSMKKSHASHTLQENVRENLNQPFNPDPIEFESAKAQREAFQQFLSERQILRNKTRKMMKNYKPEWDYLVEEATISKENQINSFNFDTWMDDDDYIEEDANENDRDSL